MVVHDNGPRPDRIWSIEISASIGRRSLVRALRSIQGVRITRTPTLLSRFTDAPFCEFEFGHHAYAVEATWPAGERFEITPVPRGCTPGLLAIREALLAL